MTVRSGPGGGTQGALPAPGHSRRRDLTEPRKPSFASTYRPGGAGAPPPARETAAGVVRPGTSRPPAPPPAEAKSVTTISHTTLPPRQHIRCFECGYEFNLTGRMHSTYCPKCKTSLDLAGYTIDSDCSDNLKTLGTIRITPRATITSARMLATEIDLAGKVVTSNLQAFGQLILHGGAEFMRKDVTSADLRLEAGGELALGGFAVYRNVDVAGVFRANLYATGRITIRSTGAVFGKVCGGHLVVEDGAALVGDIRINPDGWEQAQKKQDEFLTSSPPAELFKEHIAVGVLPAPPPDSAAASPMAATA
jgi:cytoskeletal protein CcmA (bactofilin family)